MPLNPELLIIVHRSLRVKLQASVHFNCKCPGVSPSTMSFSRRRTGAAGRRLSECRTEGQAIVALLADRIGLTYTKWWRHSRACSDMCNGRAPASDSTKPTSRARHKTDALRLKHASCFKRRAGNLLPCIPQRHTIRVFKTKVRSLRLSRRVRFVRALRAPHYK